MARNRQLMASISSIGLLLAFVLTLGYIPTASAKGAELAGTATTQATETPNQAVIDVVATPEGLDRFVVTWKTRKASRGEVLFGESPDTLTTRLADDHGGIPAKQHRALIQGVRTGTVYYFVILADDKQYDNNGTAFKVRTNVAKESPGDADRAAVAQNDQPISAQRKDDRDHPTDLVVKVGETDFSVEWQTRKAKAGWITYGQSIDQMMLRADDERGGSTIDHQHRVKVENLVPGSVYYFTLVVDGISYDNGGAAYKVRVGPAAVTEAVSPSRAIPEISGVQEPSPSIASLAAIGGSPFVYPTAGFMGEPFTSAHNGLDIWTSDPNQASCGNEVRAAFPGKVKRIWKSTTYDGSNWAGAPRGDVNAAIVVLEHTEPVPGLPSPFYTYYLHMAKDAGGTTRGPAAATCVYLSTWDKLASGEQIPAGFPLGQQGDLRLAGDRITHLHFSIATSDSGIAGPVNPAPYLGLSSLQRGNALLYSGQTINLRLSTNTEQDTIYFNADQGQVATLRMNRLNTTLDGYLYLYAPNGALVAQDDDSGGNFNPLINRVTLPQTGRYRIVASSWGGGSSGAYSLALTLETNNTTTCSPGANGVVLYEHGNYAGRCVTLTGDQVDFTTSNFNDMASSLRFVGSYASGWEAVLYEHTYYGGVSSTFRASDADLGNDTIGHDRASSVRIRQVTSEVVVDEQNTGFTKGGSYWQDDYTRGYNNHMYWTCVNGNVVDSWGEWRPNLPSARSYELFAFVPDYHTNTTNARYEIHHANGVSTVSRAQRTYSNVWVSLGTFNFSVGTAGYVRLTDATGEVASCNTQIGFDAIKWVPR